MHPELNTSNITRKESCGEKDQGWWARQVLPFLEGNESPHRMATFDIATPLAWGILDGSGRGMAGQGPLLGDNSMAVPLGEPSQDQGRGLCCYWAQHPSVSGCSPHSPCPNVHKVANKFAKRIRTTKTLGERAGVRWKPWPRSSVKAQEWTTGYVWGDAFLCCWGCVLVDSSPRRRRETWEETGVTQVCGFSQQS